METLKEMMDRAHDEGWASEGRPVQFRPSFGDVLFSSANHRVPGNFLQDKSYTKLISPSGEWVCAGRLNAAMLSRSNTNPLNEYPK